jgi:hypothetical protein
MINGIDEQDMLGLVSSAPADLANLMSVILLQVRSGVFEYIPLYLWCILR